MPTKKETILDTALELFVDKGFKATTTKEIALKSGVAEGLIFYYFKDKNGLLKQLTRRFSFIGSIQDEMTGLLGMEPVQGMLTFGHLYINFLKSHKTFLFFIWSPEMVKHKGLGEEVHGLIHSMSEFILGNLRKIAPPNTEEKALETATSMFISSLLTYAFFGERIIDQSNEDYCLEVLKLVLRGLGISDENIFLDKN